MPWVLLLGRQTDELLRAPARAISVALTELLVVRQITADAATAFTADCVAAALQPDAAISTGSAAQEQPTRREFTLVAVRWLTDARRDALGPLTDRGGRRTALPLIASGTRVARSTRARFAKLERGAWCSSGDTALQRAIRRCAGARAASVVHEGGLEAETASLAVAAVGLVVTSVALLSVDLTLARDALPGQHASGLHQCADFTRRVAARTAAGDCPPRIPADSEAVRYDAVGLRFRQNLHDRRVTARARSGSRRRTTRARQQPHHGTTPLDAPHSFGVNRSKTQVKRRLPRFGAARLRASEES